MLLTRLRRLGHAPSGAFAFADGIVLRAGGMHDTGPAEDEPLPRTSVFRPGTRTFTPVYSSCLR